MTVVGSGGCRRGSSSGRGAVIVRGAWGRQKRAQRFEDDLVPATPYLGSLFHQGFLPPPLPPRPPRSLSQSIPQIANLIRVASGSQEFKASSPLRAGVGRLGPSGKSCLLPVSVNNVFLELGLACLILCCLRMLSCYHSRAEYHT